MIAIPFFFSAAIRSKSSSTSRSVMAEVGSSMMMTLASKEIAFMISSIWISETESSLIFIAGS